MNRRILAVPLAVLALLAPAAAPAKVRVAASTTDLASIAASVGGDAVEVFAIARPGADPHRVEALPSHMVRVARARVYLEAGLGLDPWARTIIDGSRNARVARVDCSAGIPVLEKPAGRVDASMGDVHPDGNPHYWLDPRNGSRIARTVAAALAAVDPGNAAAYRARAEVFAKEAEGTWARGRAAIAGLPSRAVVTYHRSWAYFADAYGLEVVNTVEPVPGIPPTARHLAEVVRDIRASRAFVLLQEPYFVSDSGKLLARESGIRVLTVAGSCPNEKPGSYLAHAAALVAALRGGPAK